MKKEQQNKTDLVAQLADWQRIYDEELAQVRENGTTYQYNAGEGISPHVKIANMAQQNIIRISKLLDAIKDETNEKDEFADY